MTNEELVAAIKQGEKGLIYKLWEQIEGFGAWLSNKYSESLVGSGAASNKDEAFDDLYFGCCYPAFCKAIDKFDSDRAVDGGFASLFRYCFMSEAAEFYGYKKHKKDPLIDAASLNAPVSGCDDDIELAETISDPVDLYEQSDHKLYLEQLHRVMGAALNSLDAVQLDVIRKRYFERLPAKMIAEHLGTTEQCVFSIERKGFRSIQRGGYAAQLRTFLVFDYRTAGLSGNGLKAFQANGSSTERGAIAAIEMQESAKRRLHPRPRLSHAEAALQADRGQFSAGSA